MTWTTKQINIPASTVETAIEQLTEAYCRALRYNKDADAKLILTDLLALTAICKFYGDESKIDEINEVNEINEETINAG